MIYFNLRGMDEPMEHRRSRKFDDEGHDRTSVLTHCLLVESSTEIKATCKTTCKKCVARKSTRASVSGLPLPA